MARATYNPDHDPIAQRTTQIRFSAKEVQHLVLAVVGLTIGFAYVRAAGGDVAARTVTLVEDPVIVIGAFLAVASGFVLHELAHKLLAQRYGHWAEFRAQFGMLGVSVIMAMTTPLFFAAPGAVMIMGRVTPRENGLISIAGPAVNFVLAIATFPFTFLANQDAALPRIMGTIALVNSLLAVFNLIPAGPLDGKKVWTWSKLGWTLSFLAAIGLFIAVFVRTVEIG